MMHGVKVRLTVDLTKYHARLVLGVEGKTAGQTGIWSRNSDRFIGVLFPGIGTFDVLWDSLEIIDTEYLAEAAERKQKRMEALKKATKVVRTVGPAGGFKYLSYEYIDEHGTRNHTSNGNRAEAETLIKVFEENGIEVMQKKL